MSIQPTKTSNEPSVKQPEKASLKKRAENSLRMHFTLIMVLFATLGAIIMILGTLQNISVVSNLGSALFSASAVSAIFKVVGFDIYLTQSVSEAMTENNATLVNEIQGKVNVSLIETLLSLRFVEKLSDPQCRELFKQLIEKMQSGIPSPAIYETFQQLSQNLAGLVSIDRHYSVVLEYARSFGPQIIKSTINYSVKMANQSKEEHVSLFPNGVVLQGTIDTPREIDLAKLQNPEDLGRFVELRINGQVVVPDEVNHYWIDDKDKKKGSKFDVSCSRTIPPMSSSLVSPVPLNISIKTEALLDESDYILRRFLSVTEGASLTVHHPDDLETEATWFRPSEKPEVSTTTKTNTVLEQRVDSVFFPGMGFALRMRRIRRPTKPRGSQDNKTEKEVTKI